MKSYKVGNERNTSPPISMESYTTLASDDAPSEEHDPFLERMQKNCPEVFPSYVRKILIFNIVLFVMSLGCLALSSRLVLTREPVDGSRILREKTFYSPPLDMLTQTWSVSEVVTEPLSSNGSVLRQDPSPHVDSAWHRFADMGIIGLTEEQVIKLGKDPAVTVKAPASWGVGNKTYLAQLDAVHLAHCLNSMRKSLHYNFDYYYPDGIPNVYAAHLMHCQEALAKWLMCQPSMDLLTFNWVEGHQGPFPDFDMTRKCWDYDQLLEWQNDHRVQTINTDEWRAMSAPEGTKRKPSPILHEESLHRTPFNSKGN